MLSTYQIQQQKQSDLDFIENFLLEHIRSASNHNDLLLEILQHHFSSGGSRKRAQLAYFFSKKLQLHEEECLAAACVVELFHNASLIHDDIQDGDELRRNKETVWKKYGINNAICAGDFLISEAYAILAKLSEDTLSSYLISHISSNISQLIKGQMLDLSQDKNQTLNNIDTYEEIAASKSGPLLAMTLSIPLIISDKKELVTHSQSIFKHYALAYQINDDLSDIEIDQSKQGNVSGVNIITVLQKSHDESPYQSALEIAISHLKKAKEECLTIPSCCRQILLQEISLLELKIGSQL